MSWLTKFKADPQNLVGPNIAKSPVHEIDLSGTILSFKRPQQTAQIPGFIGSNSFDINKDPTYIEGPSSKNNASVKVFSSGWNFNDRVFMGKGYGGVDLHMALLKNTETRTPASSLFNKKCMETWVCESEESSYERLNKKMWDNRESYVNEITPENAFWQYPKSSDDLQWINFNHRHWVRYEIFQPDEIPSIEYEVAISHQHAIYVSWSPSTFGGLDFFGSKCNLRIVTKKFIDTMMESMTIELSPEAQQQLDEVTNKES